MFYNKKYNSTDYLTYEDMNELIDKEKELINEMSIKKVSDDEYIYVNGEEVEADSNYSLLGNTVQDGTPTPSSPVEVETVTGKQDIVVCGKNLFDGLWEEGNINSSTGQDTVATNVRRTKNYISVQPNTTYTLSRSTTTDTIPLRTYGKDKSYIGAVNCISNGEKSHIFTTGNNVYFIRLVDWSNASENVMIELSNQATTYEPFKGNSYEINLGKNLFDKNTMTTRIYGYLMENLTTWAVATGGYSIRIPCEPNTNYTISANNPNETVFRAGVTDSNNTPVSGTTVPVYSVTRYSNTNLPIYVTTGTSAKYIVIQVGADTASDTFNTLQLEKGRQATSYAEYKTPLELCKIGTYQDFIAKGTGKNLFDVSTSLTKKFISKNNGGVYNSDNWSASDFIEIEPNTTYIYYGVTNGSSGSAGTAYYDESKTYISGIDTQTYSFTTPSNAKYLRLSLNSENPTSVQIEKGNQATYFEPYGYKDKWYLYKAIDKIVLNGSENWVSWNTQSTGNTRLFGTPVIDSISKIGYVGISNYFANSSSTIWATDTEALQIASTGENQLRLRANKTVADGKDAFVTWLGTHNVSVYYVLATPTATEITDTELINQLESLWKAIRYWNYITILPAENYDLDLPIYQLNDFVFLEDIEKIENNIKQIGYDFFQPPRYIQNKIWKTEPTIYGFADISNNFGAEDLNRMITDMNILYEHKDDTPSIYNLYTNENWNEESLLEWE